ncbi:MAG: hypothetical protein ACC628_07810 [Pirellulaceae bacterium]
MTNRPPEAAQMLDREEYVEQAYLFRILGERLPKDMPLQELLRQIREELLASTRLPMAVDFLRTELEHSGACSPAMAKLSHYFSPFQTYVVREAEDERGRFDMRVALEVLRAEALYRAEKASRQGTFLFHFETLCRNKLRYDHGLQAIADDPIYDEDWREWILTVRRQVGIIDFADLLYVRSEHYQSRRCRLHGADLPPEKPLLFGEREGKIALAHRGKDPLYLFAALQRHLGYPSVPRPKPSDPSSQILPQLMRRVERHEIRIKLLEEEQREGIDITKFYRPDMPRSGDSKPP